MTPAQRKNERRFERAIEIARAEANRKEAKLREAGSKKLRAKGCGMCGRALTPAPTRGSGVAMRASSDCGGDCWGCIKKVERPKRTNKKLLFMQLKCPAPWWPRDAKKKPAWVGVMAGGCGWTLGAGDLMTADEIGDAKDSIRDSYPEAKFEIRRAS